jgi:DNA-binding transcriptional LysR family regulator
MPLITQAARYFDEVARTGSIRHAAERLHASPSAVNRQILNLEAEYGLPLFERLPRGMRLTAAGEVLLNDVRRWRRDHDRARRHLQELQGLLRGHATIGLMECLAESFAPKIISGIQEQHPGITIGAVIAGTEHLVRELAAGRLDMAIVFNAPETGEVAKAWSAPIPLGFVMASGHPLARRASVRLSECVHFPLVLPEGSLSMRGLINAALAERAIEPAPVVTANSIALIKAMLRGGNRVALLSRIDVHREVEQGGLVFRTLADSRIKPERLSICTQSGRSASPTTALVAEAFRVALADTVASL